MRSWKPMVVASIGCGFGANPRRLRNSRWKIGKAGNSCSMILIFARIIEHELPAFPIFHREFRRRLGLAPKPQPILATTIGFQDLILHHPEQDGPSPILILAITLLS